MRVLGLDPGALRLGYALVERNEDSFKLVASGITGLEQRENEKFQAFRRRIINYWSDTDSFTWLMSAYGNHHPVDLIASEIVPAVGSGNFIQATQSELVKVTIACLQTMHEIYQPHIKWKEISSSSVKKAVFGSAKNAANKKNTVTKVNMRDAVMSVFPELKERTWMDDLLPDEIDAIAVALATLGYKASVHGKA